MRFTNRYSNGKAFIMNCALQTTNGIEDVIEKLAEYEDLEEQGRIIKLPCKEGTTIYQICYKCVCTCGHTYLHNTCKSPIECRKCRAVKIERWIREEIFSLSMLDRIGVDFFITREEAEEALKDI